LKKVAVTGSYGVGKSAVCQFFKKLGAHVVDTDAIVHCLLSPGTDVSLQVRKLLGEEVVIAGEIDRTLVAQRVFADPRLLHQLETLVHPVVLEVLRAEIQKANQQNAILFVAEVPLLFEAGFENEFDITVAVLSSTSRREPPSDARTHRMFTPQQKAERAHYILKNEGTLASLQQSVLTLFNQFTQT